jgi:hypothetical protein
MAVERDQVTAGPATPAAGPEAAVAARVPVRRGVTFRAVLIGVLLVPLNVFFLVKATWMVGGFTGSETLFANTVGFLFVISLLNLWLRRRRPAWAFGAGEMIIIYSMLGISTGLVASVWDLGGSLSGEITYPFWFATDQNNWRELLWPNLPYWLTVQDRGILEGFYAGSTTAYQWDVIRAWATPALWWAALLGAILWVTLCLNSIVRRRWADEEKLPFPMTILPVELTAERSGLMSNRLFWLGVAISAGISLWGTLSSFFPALPSIPLGVDYTAFVENRRPWNFIRYRGLEWGPWSLGLCYLMPLDMAFSLFVFDLLWTAEYIAAGQFGWATSPWGGFPYGELQTAGGFIAILLTAFWLDRKYLAQIVRSAFGLPSSVPRDESEAFSPRAAVFGAVAGLAFLWWIMHRAEVPDWVALAFLAIYFMMCLVISRLRAQLGPPTHQLYGTMPNWVLPAFVSSRTLGPKTLGWFMLLRPFLQEQRNNPTPIQLEALKMSENGRMQRRRVAMALAVAAPLAVLSYFWASMHLGYQMGMGTAKAHPWLLDVARWGTDGLDSGLRYPTNEVNTSGMMAVGAGMLITFALAYMKLQFQWWPLHPVAFPLAPASTIQSMTFAILGTWLFKSLLLRYGGPRAHLRALPFFLGLLAGAATVGTLHRIIAEILGVRA